MRRATITAVLAAGLLLTACTSSDSDKAAKPSTSPDATFTPTTEETADPQRAADKALEEAEKELEDSLKELDDALGETIGIQEGTYEVTNSQPDYEDMTEALDDQYIGPGMYTTKGPADPGRDCYWARMSDASGQTILANDLTSGRVIVILGEGQFFKTSGCKPWTHTGD